MPNTDLSERTRRPEKVQNKSSYSEPSGGPRNTGRHEQSGHYERSRRYEMQRREDRWGPSRHINEIHTFGDPDQTLQAEGN